MAEEFKIAALRVVSWVDHDHLDQIANGRDHFELLLRGPLGQLGAQVPDDYPVSLSSPRMDLDDVATRAFSFVFQVGALSLKLFEPRCYYSGIGPIFREN